MNWTLLYLYHPFLISLATGFATNHACTDALGKN